MGFTNPPPIQADFLEFAHDRNGKIISAKVSRAWLRWFADFQEEVEVGLTLAQLQSELAAQSGSLAATLATNNVESIGAATFGDDYKGEWSARTHNIGDVRSYQRRYYRNKAARTAANTVTPDNDSTGWELIGAAATISINMQPNIDAIGASLYGNSYKGKWVAGTFAVNDYVSYLGRYYRCKVARSASDTSDPSQDNTGWEAIGSSFSLEGDISTARQENIDAAAAIVFGDDYQGTWEVGSYAVGDVVYDSEVEKFYECDTARTTSNTDRPSADATNWSLLTQDKRGIFAARDRAATTLPSTGVDGDLIWVAGEAYFSSWDSGIAIPSGETYPSGVAIKPNGDIVIVGSSTGKVYTYSGGSWDSGIAIPSGENYPSGVAIKPNGDFVIVGRSTDKVYTYSGGSWDSGIAIPSGEQHPSGVAIKPNGDFVIVGSSTDKVYTYSGGSWDSGIAIPSGEQHPTGVAIKPNGDFVIVGISTDKVYTYSGGSWDSGIAMPSGETSPSGIGINENGVVALAGNSTDKVYTAQLLREIIQYVRMGGFWDRAAIRAIE